MTRMMEVLELKFGDVAASNPVPAADLKPIFGGLIHRGLTLGLATMDSEALAHRTLRQLEVKSYFSFVCGYDSGFGEKPGPGMVDAFCSSTALAAADVVVVGDTPHDLKMARAAKVGMAVGVLSGASPHSALAELADHVLTDISELDSVLD